MKPGCSLHILTTCISISFVSWEGGGLFLLSEIKGASQDLTAVISSDYLPPSFFFSFCPLCTITGVMEMTSAGPAKASD